jgi:hypothetical protein
VRFALDDVELVAFGSGPRQAVALREQQRRSAAGIVREA